MEALYGSELCDDDDEHNEEEMASSPLSSKRLKVSDINITRYKILTPSAIVVTDFHSDMRRNL